MQKKHVTDQSVILNSKNIEIQRAVDDIIAGAAIYMRSIYEGNPAFQKIDTTDINCVKFHFQHVMYHTLLNATKKALYALRDSIRANTAIFTLDVSLKSQAIELFPKLSDVHLAINSIARDIVHATKKVNDWGFDSHVRQIRAGRPFFDSIARDKNFTISLLLVSGATESLKAQALVQLKHYSQFSWLWNAEIDVIYAQFDAKSPILEDFITEFQRFSRYDVMIDAIPSLVEMGCTKIRTQQLKEQMKADVLRWKRFYSKKMHAAVRRDMDSATVSMSELKSTLDRELQEGGDFAALKNTMDALAKFREYQSYFSRTFDSITERYNVLESLLPGLSPSGKGEQEQLSKDEMDAKSALRNTWLYLETQTETVIANVNKLQGGFKQVLMANVREFQKLVSDFECDYKNNGPTVPGITPQEAMVRLKKFEREYESLARKFELYRGGEILFGLREKEYPVLKKAEKDLRNLRKLYDLYSAVLSRMDEYKSFEWGRVAQTREGRVEAPVVGNEGKVEGKKTLIEEMKTTVEEFSKKCTDIKTFAQAYQAYADLSLNLK